MNGEIIRGEIYWIRELPNADPVGSVQYQNRPGIVVSNKFNNISSDTVEVVLTTAASKKPLSTHCTINSTPKESTALCEQITTISKEQLGDYIGQCTDPEMKRIERCMLTSLGFSPCLAENTKQQKEEIKSLRIALAKAEKGEELMRDLYSQLLEKITTKKRKTT